MVTYTNLKTSKYILGRDLFFIQRFINFINFFKINKFIIQGIMLYRELDNLITLRAN